MPVSINHETLVIYVPQDYLTPLSSSLYELDSDQFRLDLKALEAEADGMDLQDTHSHNTEVVLSGVTYVRTIEIINGYTIEFEDGQYTVSIIGSNHNFADVKVPNQVSLIVNNSAGNTVSNVNINNLQYLVESLRQGNSAYGNIYYWDPVNGNDSASGLQPTAPKKTFSAAQGLVVPYNSDVIFLISPSTGSAVITESITITKASLQLRGSGISQTFSPTSDAAPAITISAENVGISGFSVETTAAGTPQPAIHITTAAATVNVSDVLVRTATSHGILIEDGDYHTIRNVTIDSAAGAGVCVQDGNEIFLVQVHSEASGTWGYEFLSTDAITRTQHVHLTSCVAYGNGTGGLFIGTNTYQTQIDEDCFFSEVAGNIGVTDNGIQTVDARIGQAEFLANTLLDLEDAVENGLPLRDAVRLLAAAMAGKLSGAATTTVTIRNAVADSKNRIVSTVDASGNRTAITYDTSA